METGYLENLGLSKNESKIYQTLIYHGKLSSREISSKSGVPYGRVYDFLDGLIERGIVNVVPEKNKKFIAASPKYLDQLAENKKKEIENSKLKLKELKKFYENRESEAVKVSYGDRGFWESVKKQKDPKNYVYNLRWDMKVVRGNIKNQKDMLDKGIDVKQLTRYDEETKKNVDKWVSKFPNIRQMDNEGVAVSIIDDEEVLIGLIKSNTTLFIKDKPFSKIMAKLFLETYKNSPEIKKPSKKSKN